MSFVADPGMYAKQDRFEANRRKRQNQKFDRVGRKEIRKMDMARAKKKLTQITTTM